MTNKSMSDNATPRKEVLKIAYDQIGNIIYLAGVAIVELVMRPLFGQNGIPFLAEATLLIMDMLFFFGLTIRLVIQVDKLFLELRKSRLAKVVKSIRISSGEKNRKVRNSIVIVFIFLAFVWVNYSYITLRLEFAQLQDEIKQTQADLAAALDYCKQPRGKCDVLAVIGLFEEQIMNGYLMAEALQSKLNEYGNPIILVTVANTILLLTGNVIYNKSRPNPASEPSNIE